MYTYTYSDMRRAGVHTHNKALKGMTNRFSFVLRVWGGGHWAYARLLQGMMEELCLRCVASLRSGKYFGAAFIDRLTPWTQSNA